MKGLNNYLRKSSTIVLGLSLLFTSSYSFAASEETQKIRAPNFEKLNHKDLTEVKKLVNKTHSESIKNKVIDFSNYFAGKPYDSEKGNKLITWDKRRNKKKLIELNHFDCFSYVETILALSTMPNKQDNNKDFLREFSENLSSIMFAVNDVSYTGRNHFVDTEWLKSNEKLFAGNVFENLPYAKEKIAKIDKAAFLSNQLKAYSEKYVKEENRQKFMDKFKNDLSKFSALESKVKYISYKDFVSKSEELSKIIGEKIYLFVSVIDNDTLLESTKSEHNVGHVGFIYNKDNKILLNHASPSNNKVEIADFSEYAKSKEENAKFVGFALYELK